MNELNHSNHSKRIATNTLVLFARMLIITIVNLYTVRWVLKGLGTEDYGIYNAVAGVVTTGLMYQQCSSDGYAAILFLRNRLG